MLKIMGTGKIFLKGEHFRTQRYTFPTCTYDKCLKTSV